MSNSFTSVNEKSRSKSLTTSHDLILFVNTNGLCSPYNKHSFRRVDFFIPTQCIMCTNMAYPFVQLTTKCTKCSMYCHRHCIRMKSHICPVISRAAPNRLKCSSKLFKDNQKIARGQKFSPDSPYPGSKHCYWRQLHRDLLTRSRLIVSHHRYDSMSGADVLVKAIFSDSSSFPSLVADVLISTLIEIECTDNDLLLKHGRECLDNIGRAVVRSIHNRTEICRSELFEILNSVDQHILESNNAAIYKKLFAAAKLVANQADQKWFTYMKEFQWREADDFSEITECINLIPSQYSGVNKLKQLVKSLQLLSNQLVYCPKVQDADDNSKLLSIPPLVTNSCSIADSIIQNEGHVNDTGQVLEVFGSDKFPDLIVDADTLIQRLQMALMFSLSLSADKTPAGSGTSRWNAESVYISAMVRDEDWLLGAEGYALATLQTALL